MEQKTEASQAVNDLLPPLPEKTRHNFNVYAHDDEAMRSYALAAIHRYAMKVAAMTTHPFPVIDLKAQPAPTDPILERAKSSGGFASFTHYDATMSDDEVIAKFMGQPAPTEAAQGEQIGWVNTKYDIFIPLSGLASTKRNSELLASRELIAVYGASQLSGNSGELVQGEDSARLADGYKSSTMVSDFYGPKVTLHYETTAQADAAHDTLVSMIEQASAETGGVKP